MTGIGPLLNSCWTSVPPAGSAFEVPGLTGSTLNGHRPALVPTREQSALTRRATANLQNCREGGIVRHTCRDVNWFATAPFVQSDHASPVSPLKSRNTRCVFEARDLLVTQSVSFISKLIRGSADGAWYESKTVYTFAPARDLA